MPKASQSADAWRTDSLPFDKRPIWQFVWVQGECYHSGPTWFRQGWGTAAIRPDDAEDAFQGYRASDIQRICDDNDIAFITAEVVGWLPMVPPALLEQEERKRFIANGALELPEQVKP